ncbi:hypothetical protein HMPREF1514_0179 [Streptococcus sp. AS20]|uniref:hypothetical protein n=1 Tax=Streptococcus sp. AS20 TaxID=936578 RepID=UPI00044D1EF0|nr:hypothetical protein [Streptococcus sp. AS20]EUB26245.1 hypothetical protein HMPREF1514_0179 [Streptococcus sp. AS20]
MPSILEELPRKALKAVGKGFQFCRKKLEEYNAKMLEKEKQRRWAVFLEQTQHELMKLVKEQISSDQYVYDLQLVFEDKEIVQVDESKSVQRVHVANMIVPRCKLDVNCKEFPAGCKIFHFSIFGELDSDILSKIKEKWTYYLCHNGQYFLYGTADTYKKDGLRYLVFIIYDKTNERAVKGALFHLKNS